MCYCGQLIIKHDMITKYSKVIISRSLLYTYQLSSTVFYLVCVAGIAVKHFVVCLKLLLRLINHSELHLLVVCVCVCVCVCAYTR